MPVLNTGLACDPRFRPGAYITDGRHLYCVIGEISEPAQLPRGAPLVKLEAENCATGFHAELDVNGVRRACRLVAPAPECPDCAPA